MRRRELYSTSKSGHKLLKYIRLYSKPTGTEVQALMAEKVGICLCSCPSLFISNYLKYLKHYRWCCLRK